jgi:hypothetical protein
LQARLQMAVMDGEEFDLETGLPLSWVKGDTTWWDWSREWLDLKWPQWAGHSRRSAVESLVAITPLMVRNGAPPVPDETAKWLRDTGYRPGITTPSSDQNSGVWFGSRRCASSWART